MSLPALIGWASSVVLLITLSSQVWGVWKNRPRTESAGWLFTGQVTASVGFCTYSLLQRDWVFIITNFAILINAIIGAVVVRMRQRRPGAGVSTGPSGTVTANAPSTTPHP